MSLYRNTFNRLPLQADKASCELLSNELTIFQLKADFISLLKETSDIDRHSRWSEVKKRIDSEARYKAVDSSSRREDWFRDHVKNIGDVSNLTKVYLSFFLSIIRLGFRKLHSRRQSHTITEILNLFI